MWCERGHIPLSCGKCMDCPSGCDDRPFNAAASVSAVSSPVFLREMSATPCNKLLLYTHKDAKPSNCSNAVSRIIGRCFAYIPTFRLRNDINSLIDRISCCVIICNPRGKLLVVSAKRSWME